MNYVQYKPKKAKRAKMALRGPAWYRSHRHRAHVRRHECSIAGRCDHVCVPTRSAAHRRDGTDGCMGEKPSDFYTFSLCDDYCGGGAHGEQHNIGEAAFSKRYGIDLDDACSQMVKSSPCRQEIEDWRREHG